MTSYSDCYRSATIAYRDADAVWSLELGLVFGDEAGDARYHSRGRGEPGSNLRLAWEFRDAARQAWERSRNLPGNINHRVRG